MLRGTRAHTYRNRRDNDQCPLPRLRYRGNSNGEHCHNSPYDGPIGTIGGVGHVSGSSSPRGDGQCKGGREGFGSPRVKGVSPVGVRVGRCRGRDNKWSLPRGFRLNKGERSVVYGPRGGGANHTSRGPYRFVDGTRHGGSKCRGPYMCNGPTRAKSRSIVRLPYIQLVRNTSLRHRVLCNQHRGGHRNGHNGRHRHVDRRQAASPFCMCNCFDAASRVLLPTYNLRVGQDPGRTKATGRERAGQDATFPSPTRRGASQLFSQGRSTVELFVFAISHRSQHDSATLLHHFL